MGQISIARGVVAIDPTSAPGAPLYTDVTSPQVLYSGTSGLISGSAKFQWINSTSSLEFGTGAEIYLYNTADQTTDYERGVVKWDTNAYVIGTEKGGTGSSRTLNFQVDGTSRWYITTAGHFQTTSSNGYDIGASGSLVRSLYYGTNLDGSSGATFNLYNTADQTTNYERLRADWSSNVARLWTSFAGTAAPRSLRVGTGGGAGSASPDLGYLQISNSVTSPFAFVAASTAGTGAVGIELISQTYTSSSGTQIAARISPTINQSGTAGYTAFDINPTETATGSGSKLLQRWAVGGTEYGRVSNNGSLWTTSLVANAGTGGLIGLSSALGVTPDVSLYRDAADTLAIRRGANAQTFRVYNTYTDGSNYERGFVSWSGSAFGIGTEAAGTGSARQLAFYTGGTARWQIATGGAFIASADNTYDIGASGSNRPRNVYVAGTVLSAATRYTQVYTVATLPVAASNPYMRCIVNDSTTTAAGNYGLIVTGGGANVAPVYNDGANWRIG